MFIKFNIFVILIFLVVIVFLIGVISGVFINYGVSKLYLMLIFSVWVCVFLNKFWMLNLLVG